MLNQFAGRQILIAGDVMVDEYVWGETRRISPEAPVPVVDIRHRTFNPGGAANVAANVVSLGGSATLCGVAGEDSYAATLRNCLKRRNIDAAGIFEDPTRPTTTKSRVLAQHQQIVRLDCEDRSALGGILEEKLLQWIAERAGAHDCCVLSDYGKGVVSESFSRRFIEVCRGVGKPVIVDPKARDFRRYRGATVVTPNLLEALRAAGLSEEDGDLGRCASRLLRCLDGGALLVTRGAEGMSLFHSRQRAVHIPACARSVFDVTGAGDTVVATLSLAVAAGCALRQAADLANRAAGIVVGKLGAAAVSAEELFENSEPDAKQSAAGISDTQSLIA